MKVYAPKHVIIRTLNSLPPSATSLTFSKRFNQNIATLPHSLAHLNFPVTDHTFKLPQLPTALKHLTLGSPFYSFTSLTHLLLIRNSSNSLLVNHLPPKISQLNAIYFYLPNSNLSPMPHLTHLALYDVIDNIPPSVTHLRLYKISNFSLPPALTHFSLEGSVDSPAPISFPISTRYLSFGNMFNQQITLPPALTHLTFGIDFNMPVELPLSITHLEFGLNFNQPVLLPTSLISLKFGYNFTQKIDSIPPSLTCLSLGRSANYPLNFPPSITDLTFYQLPCILPPSSLAKTPLDMILDHLPKLSHLVCDNDQDYFTKFPPSLSHFTVGVSFNRPLPPLPPNLTSLRMGIQFNHPLSDLPPSLLDLKLGYWFNHPLPSLPPSLSSLTLGCCFNQPLPPLPLHLTHLILAGTITYSLPPLLSSITHLAICNTFDIATFPSLVSIAFPQTWSTLLGPLPSSLKTVVFCNPVQWGPNPWEISPEYIADCPIACCYPNSVHIFSRTRGNVVAHSIVWHFFPSPFPFRLIYCFQFSDTGGRTWMVGGLPQGSFFG